MYVVLFPGLVLWNVTGRYLANYAVMLTLRSIYTDKFLDHSDFSSFYMRKLKPCTFNMLQCLQNIEQQNDFGLISCRLKLLTTYKFKISI